MSIWLCFFFLFFVFTLQGDLEKMLKSGTWSRSYIDMDLDPVFSGSNTLPGALCVSQSNLFTHFYDDYAILWGGMLCNTSYYTTDVWYYSYSKKKWEFVAGPKGKYDTSDGMFPNGREHSGFAVDTTNHKLYIIGGNGTLGRFKDIWAFSGDSKKWEKLYGDLNGVSEDFFEPFAWLYYKDGLRDSPMLRFMIGKGSVVDGERSWESFTMDINDKTVKPVSGSEKEEYPSYGSGNSFPYYSEKFFGDISARFKTKSVDFGGIDHFPARFCSSSFNIDYKDHVFCGPIGDNSYPFVVFENGEKKNIETVGLNYDDSANGFNKLSIPSGIAFKVESSYFGDKIYNIEIVVFSGVKNNSRFPYETISDNIYHYSFEDSPKYNLDLLTLFNLLYGSNPLHLFIPIFTYLIILAFYTVLLSLAAVVLVLLICFPIACFISLPALLSTPCCPLVPYCCWGCITAIWCVLGYLLSFPSQFIGSFHSQIDEWITVSFCWNVCGLRFMDNAMSRYFQKKMKNNKKELKNMGGKTNQFIDMMQSLFDRSTESKECYDRFFKMIGVAKSVKGKEEDDEEIIIYEAESFFKKITLFCLLEPFLDPVYVPKLSQCILTGNIIHGFMQGMLALLTLLVCLFTLPSYLLGSLGDPDYIEESRETENSIILFQNITVMSLFTIDMLYGLFLTISFIVPCCERIIGIPEGSHYSDGIMTISSNFETVVIFVVNDLLLALLFLSIPGWMGAILFLILRLITSCVTCDNQFCDLFNSGFLDDSLCCFFDILHICRLPFNAVNCCVCICQECCCCAFAGMGIDFFFSSLILGMDCFIMVFLVLFTQLAMDRYELGNTDIPQSDLLLYKAIIFWAFFFSGIVDIIFEVTSSSLRAEIGDDTISDVLPEDVKEKIRDYMGDSDVEEEDDDDDEDEKPMDLRMANIIKDTIFTLLKSIRFIVGKICYLLISPSEVVSNLRFLCIVYLQAVWFLEEMVPSNFLFSFTPYVRAYDPVVFFAYIIVPAMFWVMCFCIFCDIFVLLPRSLRGSFFICRNVNTVCDYAEKIPSEQVFVLLLRNKSEIAKIMSDAKDAMSTNDNESFEMKERTPEDLQTGVVSSETPKKKKKKKRDSFDLNSSSDYSSSNTDSDPGKKIDEDGKMDKGEMEDLTNLADFQNYDDDDDDFVSYNTETVDTISPNLINEQEGIEEDVEDLVSPKQNQKKSTGRNIIMFTDSDDSDDSNGPSMGDLSSGGEGFGWGLDSD